jgi:hypothetical protein
VAVRFEINNSNCQSFSLYFIPILTMSGLAVTHHDKCTNSEKSKNEVQALPNAKTVAKDNQKLHERLKQSKKT